MGFNRKEENRFSPVKTSADQEGKWNWKSLEKVARIDLRCKETKPVWNWGWELRGNTRREKKKSFWNGNNKSATEKEIARKHNIFTTRQSSFQRWKWKSNWGYSRNSRQRWYCWNQSMIILMKWI